MKRYKLTFGYLFILFAFSFSCRPEGEVVRADIQNFTIKEQAKIGNELSRHITSEPSRYNIYRPAQNQKIYSYLNDLLRTIRLTETVVNRDNFNWEVFIVRDENSMSAFTLPGGKVYITSSFLRFIKSEAQLMAVLSHEMCYADHSLAMSKLQENFSGLILGDLVFNNPVDEKDDMVETLQSERFDSLKVHQADLYSIDVLCPFQYEADGISTIISNITDDDYPLEWLDTRPGYTGRSDTILTRASVCGTATEEALEEQSIRYKNCLVNLLD